MRWLDYETGNCSVQRTLEIIGEKWTILVLREVFNGVRRFDQIRDHTGMSDAVLSARLRRLTSEGILLAATYREPGQRSRKEYRLTEKGLDLHPVLIALLQWGDRHRSDPAGPAVVFSHRGCAAPVRAVVQCARGHAVTASETASAPGPGARLAVSADQARAAMAAASVPEGRAP